MFNLLLKYLFVYSLLVERILVFRFSTENRFQVGHFLHVSPLVLSSWLTIGFFVCPAPYFIVFDLSETKDSPKAFNCTGGH